MGTRSYRTSDHDLCHAVWASDPAARFFFARIYGFAVRAGPTPSMWVIFFQGTPHFWLIGGEAYRVGKKDCHVVIQDDRSISRTHLTITVGLQPVPSSASSPSSPASLQATASLGAPAPHRSNHGRQPHHAEDEDSGAPQPITLLDSSTYGTSVTACGRLDSEDAETNDDGGGGVSPTLDPGVLGLCYAPAARKRQRSSGSVPRAPAAPAAPQPTLQLTKEVPYHVPVHRRAWQEFVVRLGHHGATLKFVWVDVAVLCEDVDVEVQVKLTHALRCCGARQVVAAPGGAADEEVDELTTTHVSNSAPADGRRGSETHGSSSVTQSHPKSTLTVLGGSGLSLTQRTVSGTAVQTAAGTQAATAPPPPPTPPLRSPVAAAAASPASLSCAPQRCYDAVSFLVASTVQPSTAVVAMLCRAVPVVSPAFFLAIRNRASPQIPLPDPGDFLPPLAPWWCDMLAHVALPPPSAPASTASPAEGSGAAATSLTATSSPASTAADAVQAQQQRRCFAPHPERRALFRDVTFLLVQRPLYDEVASYLDGAGAELVWADVAASGLGGLAAWIGAGPSGAVVDIDCDAAAARDAMAALQAFFAQHQRCVLLYSETELDVPWAGAAVAVLRHGLGLRAVEYAQLVESIVALRPLALPPYPTLATMPQTLAEVVARLAEAKGHTDDGVDLDRTQDDWPQEGEEADEGRRSDAQPLFPELGRATAGAADVAVPPACGGDARGDSAAASAARLHRRPRKESADGWVSFEAAAVAAGVAASAHAAPSAANSSSARTAQLQLGPVPLPPYPCFADVTPTYCANTTSTIIAGGTALGGGKVFVKQALPPSEPLAELEQNRARQQLAASMLTARVPTVDAEGVVPEQVMMGGSRGGLAGRVAAAELASGIAFNAFDTAAHHASSRRRGTVARRGVCGAPRAARSRGDGSVRVDVDVDAAYRDAVAGVVDGRVSNVPAAPPRATVPTSSADSTFHIFDIDGIF